jgi:formate-dependent nitrite reductase membrane component NrfD
MNAPESSPRRPPKRGRRGGEPAVTPEATFSSYYGRPVVKAAPWTADIPAYLFFGGLAGGSALLGAGGDLTRRPALRRAGRLGAVGSIGVGAALLVHDLGRPARFANMLRVAKPTSPMSVGTWLLSAFGPAAGVAAGAEVAEHLPGRAGELLSAAGRPAGIVAAAVAPAIMSYTAVLLSDTATPSWHEGYRQLPFVFVGSSAAAAGGLAMVAAPVDEAGPARRAALAGAALELAAQRRMEAELGPLAEPFHEGAAGVLLRVSRALTAVGAGAALLAARSRAAAAASGVALLAASACTRFGIFHAGQQSARDPKHTVAPQRERLNSRV